MSRPYITLSYAQSLDGRVATSSGDSRWISCPETLKLSHELRRDNDAVLVGVGTVLQDNPLLTCRIQQGFNPLRVVLDSQFRTPVDFQVCNNEAPTVVFGDLKLLKEPRALELASKVEIQGVGMINGFLDIHEILALLYQVYKVESLYVEGGKGILTSFFKAELVDQALLVLAPLIIGQGLDSIGDLGVDKITQALRPKVCSWEQRGVDMVARLIFREREDLMNSSS